MTEHFPFTFHFHALEKEMATHSSVLAWRIPWTEEPGGLQSTGSQRVTPTHTHTPRKQNKLGFREFHIKKSEVAQSCLTLCDPKDCSPPGSSIHGIFQARVLEWAAISFSRGSSRPRDRTSVSCIAGRCFTI